MPNHTEYRAFTITYDEPVNKLVTPVGVLPVLTANKAAANAPVEVDALWDTGATMTCIKPALFDRLELHLQDATRHTMLAGIGGKIAAKLTQIHLFLVYNLEIEYLSVCVADFPSDADILIGMNVIGMGDFAVCNTDNKTSFSFVIPPFPNRINFADQADAANKLTTQDSIEP